MINWYNENSFRDWPFVSVSSPRPDSPTLPRDLVLDLGIVVPIGVEWGRSDDWRLSNIIRTETAYEVWLRLATEEAFGIKFTRPIQAPANHTAWVNNADLYRFCVFGSDEAWNTFLPGPGFVNFTTTEAASNWRLEPGCFTDYSGTTVSSLTLGNQLRFQPSGPAAVPSAPARAVDWTIAGKPFSRDANQLNQVDTLEAGYNCEIHQTADNSLTISASRRSLSGPACADVPVSQLEREFFEENGYITGGSGFCADSLISINGATGPHLKIKAGPGLTLTPITNGLRIDKTLPCFVEIETTQPVTVINGNPTGTTTDTL